MVNQHLKDIDKYHTTIIRILEGIGAAGATAVGQPELDPLIVGYGETLNAGWDEVDDVVGQVKDTANHAQSVYGAGSRQMQQIKQKVAFINSTIEQHNSQYTSMPQSKSKRLNSGVAEMPRSHSVPVLETRTGGAGGSKAGNRAAIEHFSLRNPKTPVISSALSTNLSYFDSHLIEGPSEKTLTSLNVKIGKQEYPDVITPFLKNLAGHGKIRMQFAGRCIAAIDSRHTHMQVFRHRLSAGTDFTGAEWPTGTPGTADYILGPQNTVLFKVDGGGPATVNAGFPINSTSFRDIINKTCYWAPYNKADLEDLSWNLNSLKIDNGLWEPVAASVQAVAVAGGPTVTIPVNNLLQGHFETNAKLFQPDDHARQSHIAKNNKEAVVLPPSSTTRPGSYRYNAVFNKGSIEYDFMNKGTGGAKVELIIYRLKKNISFDRSGATMAANASDIPQQIFSAIGAGYMETCVEKGGTDKLLGRPPIATDVSENPAFPFLPTLKKTVGASMQFSEISRQTFAMPSGSRRAVTISLPGDVYDPANLPAIQSIAGTANQYPGIIDNGTYCIMMSVSGVKCTKEVAVSGNVPGAPKGDYNIGDMFAAANIQFYGTYTEHMGACQYKAERAANIYTQGALLQTPAPANYVFTPVTMLPQDSAVRIGQVPGGQPGGGQSNLNFAFDAEPL